MTVPVGTTGRNPEVDYPRESLKGKETFERKRSMPKWGDEISRRMRARAASPGGDEISRRMRARAASPAAETPVDYFDGLPDDLVVCVLFKLSSSAASPSDFMCAALTCKRFKKLAFHPLVLLRGSMKMFAIKAKNWSESAHRFLKLCVDTGNLDACYTLGMIRFYCLQDRCRGASLMAKAAIGSHAAALYSLAVIQFNGSGGSKNDKDLKAGVALCARAAFFGHVDALRELGHCLQDGYGVQQNIADGRKFLVQANARELAAGLLSTSGGGSPWLSLHRPLAATAAAPGIGVGCPLLSDFGCSVPAPELHPVNSFLVDWFNARGGIEGGGEGLRICSHPGCGRPETRRHEFRRCSICGKVNYCSRACQALDWKLVHKAECAPVDQWVVDAVAPPENGGSDDEMD